MELTKYTHACVRLTANGTTIVIDPGTWTEPRAIIGADAVLVTHEHTDHIDVLRLAGTNIPVYAPARANLSGLEHTRGINLITVHTGESFDVAGVRVRAYGGEHAPIYGPSPCANLGYLIEGVYHPGDSLAVPDEPVDLLCVPAQASWLKLAEAIDFVTAIKPARAIPVHDAQLNERGLAGVNHYLRRAAGDGYAYLGPGEQL